MIKVFRYESHDSPLCDDSRILTKPFEADKSSHRPPHDLAELQRDITSQNITVASQNREVIVDDVRHVEQHAGGDVHEHQYLNEHGAVPAAALRLAPAPADQRSPTAR